MEDTKKMETKETDGIYIHELKKPFKYEGKEYKSMSFDWNKLTGEDGLSIEEEMERLGSAVLIPAYNSGYLSRMAARASLEGVPLNALLALPLKDYNAIRVAARSFLLRTESQEENG